MRDYSLLAKFNDTDLSAKFTILTGFLFLCSDNCSIFIFRREIQQNEKL